MLTWFKADLHVHTCLSPCGDLAMSPRKIIQEARDNTLDLIAVTDHNTAGNASAAMQAARGTSIVVLPGLEVCSAEEVHVLALFDMLPEALEMQESVFRGISATNDPDAFGLQVIANADDEVEGFEERLLIGATDMTIEEIVRRIHNLNGLAIASHVDRQSFGILGQLGFIPAGLSFDALEISGSASDDEAGRLAREYERYACIRNSDAHAPGQVGRTSTSYLLEWPTCRELQKAFRHQGARTFVPAHVAHEHHG